MPQRTWPRLRFSAAVDLLVRPGVRVGSSAAGTAGINILPSLIVFEMAMNTLTSVIARQYDVCLHTRALGPSMISQLPFAGAEAWRFWRDICKVDRSVNHQL
jgi:hypothetical protein